MSCALRRFQGCGTSGYRPSNIALQKEVNDKLQQMIAERNRQDSNAYNPPTPASDTNRVMSEIQLQIEPRH